MAVRTANSNNSTGNAKALSHFNWEEVLKSVDSKWHDAFRKYVTTGEACDKFLDYIDTDPTCEVALDAVLDFMMQGFGERSSKESSE